MGGGHVSRPDFGMPQPDAAYPLTEFYLLAQQALEKSGSFMLPALYAGLQAPARRIYREEAAGYLQLAAAPADSACGTPAAAGRVGWERLDYGRWNPAGWRHRNRCSWVAPCLLCCSCGWFVVFAIAVIVRFTIWRSRPGRGSKAWMRRRRWTGRWRMPQAGHSAWPLRLPWTRQNPMAPTVLMVLKVPTVRVSAWEPCTCHGPAVCRHCPRC